MWPAGLHSLPSHRPRRCCLQGWARRGAHTHTGLVGVQSSVAATAYGCGPGAKPCRLSTANPQQPLTLALPVLLLLGPLGLVRREPLRQRRQAASKVQPQQLCSAQHSTAHVRCGRSSGAAGSGTRELRPGPQVWTVRHPSCCRPHCAAPRTRHADVSSGHERGAEPGAVALLRLGQQRRQLQRCLGGGAVRAERGRLGAAAQRVRQPAERLAVPLHRRVEDLVVRRGEARRGRDVCRWRAGSRGRGGLHAKNHPRCLRGPPALRPTCRPSRSRSSSSPSSPRAAAARQLRMAAQKAGRAARSREAWAEGKDVPRDVGRGRSEPVSKTPAEHVMVYRTRCWARLRRPCLQLLLHGGEEGGAQPSGHDGLGLSLRGQRQECAALILVKSIAAPVELSSLGGPARRWTLSRVTVRRERAARKIVCSCAYLPGVWSL